MNETYYIGSDLKFRFTLTANGFDQDKNRFSITIYSGNRSITWCSWKPEDEEHFVHNPDGWFLLIPTEFLSTGPLKIVATAQVPDEDFPTSVRREVAVAPVGTIKKVN